MTAWGAWMAALRAAPRVDPGRTLLPSGPSRRVVKDRQRLAREGECFWGYVTLTAPAVWHGQQSGPAMVLFSRDPWFDTRPSELEWAARAFPTQDALEGVRDPAIQALGRLEMFGPDFEVALPPALTRGRTIVRSTTWIRLDDLPGRALRRAMLPLWVDGQGLTIPVTAAHWPPGLRQAWEP